MAVDILVRTSDLAKYPDTRLQSPSNGEFQKLVTILPQEVFSVPLYPAFHCALFIAPTEGQ